jgi:hypothetical protein
MKLQVYQKRDYCYLISHEKIFERIKLCNHKTIYNINMKKYHTLKILISSKKWIFMMTLVLSQFKLHPINLKIVAKAKSILASKQW